MEEKKTWGGGCGQRDRLAEGSSRFLSDLGASSFAVVFPALEIFLEGSWVQAGIVVIYLASSFSGGRMAGKHGGKTAVSLGHLLWNRVFCHSDHRLRSLPAGRICRSRKTSVGGSSLCRRRNGRRNDGTRQIKADKTEHFFKKQTFKFEKPML